MCDKCVKRKFNKEEMAKMKLASECGLAFGGVDDEGELEFIGTDEQWKEFEARKDEVKENIPF